MSKRYIGSIDIDALAHAVKEKHSSVTTGNNGKRYAAITIWENEDADQYGNTISIQLQSKKDVQEAKVYVGRAKPPQQLAPVAATVTETDNKNEDGLPF